MKNSATRFCGYIPNRDKCQQAGEGRARVSLSQESFFCLCSGHRLSLSWCSAVACCCMWIYFWHPLHSQQMGSFNSFGIPRVPPLPTGLYGGGRSAHRGMPWLFLGGYVVSGTARGHFVRCRTGPCTPARFGSCAVCQEPCRCLYTPVQPLCLGITRHTGLVHVRFWLLSNCMVGLSQKNTPSVWSINVKYAF